MKKLLIFILFLTLFSCNYIGKDKQNFDNFNCPRVFFSSEDRIFIDTVDGRTSIDDVNIKAELNNFAFIEKCYAQKDVAIIPINILIIAQRLGKFENTKVSMPLYAILLDQNDKVLETQYFMVSNSINQNVEAQNFLETDITEKLLIVTKNFQTTQVVIGFMLDDQKRLLIN
jgi:hypothetical protein